MRTRGKRDSATVHHSRWIAYTTAAAATAFGSATGVEATITYSGLINRHFDAPLGGTSTAHFQLDRPGDSIELRQLSFTYAQGGVAAFVMRPTIVSGALAAFYRGSVWLASKLNAGQVINSRAVGFYGATLAFGPGRYDSQWLQPGTGFVGFRFNGGAGQQFGWARITMDGAPENNFTLVDYAFADPGQRITAGQTTVPDSGGSLGLLAIGFAGLLAWRFRRANVAESIAE